ncbi:MAG: amidohydrolase family protein [Desulforegulaceae bacterium]|nr:amidohydrolase family protein [Desulforegulaceae bacterium]
MIIDCHAHIFPEKIKKNRELYFEKEKEFSWLYKNPKSKLCTAKELIESMDKNKINKTIVFGFPWNNKENAEFNNDYVMEKSIQFKDRLIPFACFNPEMEYAEKEAERAFRSKFTGFGELGFYTHDFDEYIIKKLDPIMELSKKNSIPLIFHTNEEAGHNYPGKAPITASGILKFIEKFKSNKILLAHLGGGILFFNLLKNPPQMDNIFFDTAAIPFIYKKNIYEFLSHDLLKDKVVFGSDWPLLSPERYFREINENCLSESFKKKLFFENITAFLNFN